MNIPYHAHILLGYVPFETVNVGDQLVSFVNTVFFDGRFRTLFCLLFGVGLAIQFSASQAKGIDSTSFLKSRLRWLLLFGCIHAVFIFGGDILMLYSITGMLIISNLALSQGEIIKKAKKFIIIGSILSLIMGASSAIPYAMDISALVTRGSSSFIESYDAWFFNYINQILMQAGFAVLLLLLSPLFILWQALGLMYLGIYLYRDGFFENGFAANTFNKLLIVAVLSTSICAILEWSFPLILSEAMPAFSSVSAIFVALVYAHIAIKICQKNKPKSMFVKVFSAPGKVAFSLYIFQSILMGLLLRWVVPEFYKVMTQFDFFVLVILMTILQIMLAKLYLNHYKQGPLEKLWRFCYASSNRNTHS
ncbi:DUF418 domain-containing protein [Glaciecola petra]|uniref:DUF418 domain-containing protein n=1 Tax=Glaciecola petra TaxID=3075602 RepID=A0ABU2ZS80_9ALTE|nr:DUF418 domain-containing protein [Aestuariibacter sp. P117]MDT0595486.1 DUF418 domain-containing protein [Aestuariibacter sp. P117]